MQKHLTISALLIMLSSLVVSGCCNISNFAGFRDESFSGTPYTKAAVFVPFQDLDRRLTIEDGIVLELTKNSRKAKRGVDVAIPTRDWTNEQIDSLCLASGIDVLIAVTLLSSESKTSYTPGKTETHLEQDNSGSGVAKSRIVTTTTQGSTSTTTTNTYQIQVMDIAKRTRVWIGTFKATPSMLNKCSTKLAEFVSEKLIADGIL